MGFLDVSQFPFLRSLEDHWREIHEELLALTHHDFVPWPQLWMYERPGRNDRGWWVLGIYGDLHPHEADRLRENRTKVPRTAELLREVPGLVEAAFSALLPNTHLSEHVGPERGMLRFHLGLEVPEDCGFRVADMLTTWAPGESLAFDDTVPHEAWNMSSSIRVVLMMDIDCEKAGIERPLALASGLRPGPPVPESLEDC